MFKRTTVLMLVTLLGTGLVATPVARAQTTWYVDDDAPNDPGPGDPNVSDPDEDGSPEHPFDAIQEGINAAGDGDTVLALDGTYTGTGNRDLDFNGKAITVRSANGPDNCIVDCQQDGRGFYFHSGETPDSVVHGLTVRNGWVDWDSPAGEYGGGIYCFAASPTISNCVIARNTAYSPYSYGHGIYCWNTSNPVLTDCLIIGNAGSVNHPSLAGMGGGMYSGLHSNPTLIRCRLVGNSALSGAGMYNDSDSNPLLLDCLFIGNRAKPRSSWIVSGGLDNDDHSCPTVVCCAFVGNSASFGGAIGNYDHSDATIIDCFFGGNVAVAPGFYVAGGAIGINESNPTIVNCTIAGNWADQGSALGARTTEYYPVPSGEIRNCVLWNAGDEIAVSGPCEITITHSDVEGGWTGEGNIDGAPLFKDGPSGTWTADGVYDPEAYQITFTDQSANWSENELAGKFVNPDTTQALQFVIVENTGTTMRVWADWTAIDGGTSWVTAGMSYQVHDYRLTGGASPCIDAADNQAVPADEFDLDEDGNTDEPIPLDLDGNPRFVDDPDTDDTGNPDPDYPDLPIVDMGAYEFQGCPGDIDGDGDTDHADLGALLGAWGSQPGDPNWNENADLDGDGEVGHGDLGVFLPDWGCGT